MPRLVYLNPNNLKQQFVTGLIGDPAVPAGYILTSGSDGAPDAALQQYVAGVNSGGYPAYTGDTTQNQVAVNLKAQGAKNLWINGVITGGTGDK